jgi:hypothetical protein
MKNIMEIGTHKIVGKMGKINPKYRWKSTTPNKWMFMI